VPEWKILRIGKKIRASTDPRQAEFSDHRLNLKEKKYGKKNTYRK